MPRITVNITLRVRQAISTASAATARRGASLAMLGVAPGKNNAGVNMAVMTAGEA